MQNPAPRVVTFNDKPVKSELGSRGKVVVRSGFVQRLFSQFNPTTDRGILSLPSLRYQGGIRIVCPLRRMEVPNLNSVWFVAYKIDRLCADSVLARHEDVDA